MISKLVKAGKERHARLRNRRGIAIITVLSVLLLMSVLVLAIFTMASNEYEASTSYDYTLRTRQAADTVVSMVIAQIRKATTQQNSGPGGGFSWANSSQACSNSSPFFYIIQS